MTNVNDNYYNLNLEQLLSTCMHPCKLLTCKAVHLVCFECINESRPTCYLLNDKWEQWALESHVLLFYLDWIKGLGGISHSSPDKMCQFVHQRKARLTVQRDQERLCSHQRPCISCFFKILLLTLPACRNIINLSVLSAPLFSVTAAE